MMERTGIRRSTTVLLLLLKYGGKNKVSNGEGTNERVGYEVVLYLIRHISFVLHFSSRPPPPPYFFFSFYFQKSC